MMTQFRVGRSLHQGGGCRDPVPLALGSDGFSTTAPLDDRHVETGGVLGTQVFTAAVTWAKVPTSKIEAALEAPGEVVPVLTDEVDIVTPGKK